LPEGQPRLTKVEKFSGRIHCSAKEEKVAPGNPTVRRKIRIAGRKQNVPAKNENFS
jgi:hypothetical protein